MENDRNDKDILSRRRLLMRVGLAASAAYVAPVMMGLNAAHASGNSGGYSGGNSGNSGGNSGASRGNSGGASRGNSRPSRGRRSAPSRRRGGNGQPVPAWLRRLMQG
jgi:hypothetical protein